jgi:hypothetical protein
MAFHYREEIDPGGTPQFGLIAEEVEKVNPDLIVRDDEGKAYTVRYDAVNAMLLNEFLKEHKKVEEQGATIAQLKKQIDNLTAIVQKVSGQLEEKLVGTKASGQSLKLYLNSDVRPPSSALDLEVRRCRSMARGVIINIFHNCSFPLPVANNRTRKVTRLLL